MEDKSKKLFRLLEHRFNDVHVYDSLTIDPRAGHGISEEYPSVVIHGGTPEIRPYGPISGARKIKQSWYIMIAARSVETIRALSHDVTEYLNGLWLDDETMVRPNMAINYQVADNVLTDPTRRVWRTTIVLESNGDGGGTV